MNYSFAPQPNLLSQKLQAAAEAWKRRDYQKSIDILKQACELAPGEPRILLQLGFCYGLCYDFTAAERNLEKAVNIAVRKDETLIAAGLQCLNFRRADLAEKFFEQALQQNGNALEPLVQLAEIRERQNRLDDAGHLVKRALKLNPNAIPALLILGRLQRAANQEAEAEASLRRCASIVEAPSWMRARAWYELGGLFERQGRFDDAMSSFLQAKALAKDIAERVEARRAAQADLKKTMEVISFELLQRWHKFDGAFAPRRQLAVLCGHPRSGTTLLEQVLDAHPDILSVEETSIFFEETFMPLGRNQSPGTHYMPALDSVPPALLAQARKNYYRCAENFLHQTVDDRLLVDKNPMLTILLPAIIRIFPESKFLIALRDPRDVCISCFTQAIFPVHRISSVYPTLEATVEDYSLTMSFWQQLKPMMPNPFLEVRYEDLIDDLESVARRTMEFLEVPWHDQILNFQKHAQNKLVRSPTYAEVRKPVSKRAVGRWRNYQKYIEPYLPALEPFVKAFGYE